MNPDSTRHRMFSSTHHLYFLAKLIVHCTNKPIMKLKDDLNCFATIHFECLFRVFGNTIPQGNGFFANFFLNNLHGFHTIHTVIGSSIVASTVRNQIVVILIEHKCNRLHDIMVMIPSINPVAVLIQVVIIENDLLIILNGVLQSVHIVINVFIAMLTGVETHHIAFQDFRSVRSA